MLRNTLNKIVIFAWVLSIAGCGPNLDIKRTLEFVDLSDRANAGFRTYPDDIVSITLEAAMTGSVPVFEIDYEYSAAAVEMAVDTFKNRFAEPFLDFDFDPETDSLPSQTWSYEDFADYFLSITLVSIDKIATSAGESRIEYLNFYHPGDVTPEGINRYIASVKYDDVIDLISSRARPALWSSWGYGPWGWFGGDVFLQDFQTSNRLAIDYLTGYNVVTEVDSIWLNKTLSENPNLFSSRISLDGNQVDIHYQNDSISKSIGQASWQKPPSVDTTLIQLAIDALIQDEIQKSRLVPISENGRFINPLQGKDPLTSKFAGINKSVEMSMSNEQLFEANLIERLLVSPGPEFEKLPELVYNGVRDGLINPYENESLSTLIPSGSFFNRMLVNEQDNLMIKTEHLELYQIVTKLRFKADGQLHSREVVGLGFFIPGKYVPEGFNRQIAFFLTEDVNEMLATLGNEKLDSDSLAGFPLSRTNIQVSN